jgi:signal transduction histidine kinase
LISDFSVIRDEHNDFAEAIGVDHDITRMKKLLEELEQTNRHLRNTQTELVRSGKMDSLSRLVAGVAHEINTPIGAVVSMHDTLVRTLDRLKQNLEAKYSGELENDPKLRSAFELIQKANVVIGSGCSRVAEIVRRLRSFARLDEAELKKVDIHEGLEDTLILLRHEMKHHIRVHRNYEDIPPISVYPGRLNQVFLNILNNAREAIRDEGEITITTFIESGRVGVAFRDTGMGIPEKNLKDIFDPGFTTKGVGVGTGLGLSICYQIMQDHKGEIQVESEEGKGSTFTINLPMNLRELLEETK